MILPILRLRKKIRYVSITVGADHFTVSIDYNRTKIPTIQQNLELLDTHFKSHSLSLDKGLAAPATLGKVLKVLIMRERHRAVIPIQLARTLLEILRGDDQAVEVSPGAVVDQLARVRGALEVSEDLVRVGVADLTVSGCGPVVADILELLLLVDLLIDGVLRAGLVELVHIVHGLACPVEARVHDGLAGLLEGDVAV